MYKKGGETHIRKVVRDGELQSFNIEDIQSYNTLTTSDNSERSININLNINFNRLNFKHKKAFLRNFTLRQAIYKPKESNVMI